MPRDVHAAIGALVRAEITRTHDQSPRPPAEGAAASEEIVAPKPPAPAAPPEPVRRRLRIRATAVLRRLALASG